MKTHIPFLVVAASLALVPAWSATVYNEAVSGDLSNNGLAPTTLALGPGSNQVLGTTGRGSTSIDRDYFTITVPTGFQIGQLIELPGTEAGGAVSFLGLQAGPQVTVATSATTAAGLLGWTHYGPDNLGTDLLPGMSEPNTGSSGFSSLPAGQYSFWIQDFNPGTFAYGFDIELTPAPEPAAYATLPLALTAMALYTRRRLRKTVC